MITFFISPIDEDRCALFSGVQRDDLDGDTDRLAEAIAFEHTTVAEDMVIQQGFHDRSIPLDLTAEVHTKADRMTVELRRILKDFVAEAALTAPPAAEPATEVADTGTDPAEGSSDGSRPTSRPRAAAPVTR